MTSYLPSFSRGTSLAPHGYQGWSPDPSDIPALLRGARGAYANTIVAGLLAAGFEDLPRNGPFVLGGMANHGGSAVEMIRSLGVTRQAASQLIDTLVLRGYLDRQINRDDRRRMDIELTDAVERPPGWSGRR